MLFRLALSFNYMFHFTKITMCSASRAICIYTIPSKCTNTAKVSTFKIVERFKLNGTRLFVINRVYGPIRLSLTIQLVYCLEKTEILLILPLRYLKSLSIVSILIMLFWAVGVGLDILLCIS